MRQRDAGPYIIPTVTEVSSAAGLNSVMRPSWSIATTQSGCELRIAALCTSLRFSSCSSWRSLFFCQFALKDFFPQLFVGCSKFRSSLDNPSIEFIGDPFLFA